MHMHSWNLGVGPWVSGVCFGSWVSSFVFWLTNFSFMVTSFGCGSGLKPRVHPPKFAHRRVLSIIWVLWIIQLLVFMDHSVIRQGPMNQQYPRGLTWPERRTMRLISLGGTSATSTVLYVLSLIWRNVGAIGTFR